MADHLMDELTRAVGRLQAAPLLYKPQIVLEVGLALRAVLIDTRRRLSEIEERYGRSDPAK